MSETEMPALAKDALRKIGDFGPTAHVASREVKGYAAWGDEEPGKTYVNADELRNVGLGLIAAADWLDARFLAASAPEPPSETAEARSPRTEEET